MRASTFASSPYVARPPGPNACSRPPIPDVPSLTSLLHLAFVRRPPSPPRRLLAPRQQLSYTAVPFFHDLQWAPRQMGVAYHSRIIAIDRRWKLEKVHASRKRIHNILVAA
jgi:hypothetical protein